MKALLKYFRGRKLSDITSSFSKMLKEIDAHNKEQDEVRRRHANNIQYAQDDIRFSQGQIDASLAETDKALRIREKISSLVEV